MKSLITIIFLLTGLAGLSQKDLEKMEIRILPESELIIAGSTNVNTFNCKFDMDLICDWNKIQFNREDKFLIFNDLILPLRTDGFDCGNKRMNSDFQDLLMSESYPEIRIRIEKIELFHGDFNKAYLKVELAGKTRDYDLPVLVSKDHFKGKFKMNIRDFGLEPPKKALGLIEVDEIIEVIFDLKLNQK
ncbi:hypothetical protein GCM10023115_37640 [Pontixanthobacter gangjinensis]|uniref:YceI family protein n=1 Tax=Christiangramia aestuarii TaxID=1028746 RepID=A0A7K1LQI1_9FLAO|nr:YceI family protein [Christiangramia aestuarii]MUP43069.1 YceI family protein [Christiangramia aestuarii]